MKRFLFINPFGIGDVLFTTPSVRAVRVAYPDSYIGFWCNERTREVLKNNPDIDRIFALSRGDIKKISKNSKIKGLIASRALYKDIRRDKFDIALDYSLDRRYAVTSWLCGIKRRIGFNYRNRGKFLTDKIDIDGYSSKHMVEYFLELPGVLNIVPREKNLVLPVEEESEVRIKEVFKASGINQGDLVIGIAPGAGASWGKDAGIRHWPVDKFAGLANKLSSGLKAKIVLLGDTTERTIGEKVVSLTEIKPLNLMGKTTIEEFVAAVRHVNVFISNDGGPCLMAVAAGAKTVSLFGPVDPKVYGPYPPSSKHIVLRKQLECSPCYSQFRLTPCKRNKECLNSIEVNEVFNAAKSLIGG